MIDTQEWIEKVSSATSNLASALEMMDSCRRDPEQAAATGATRDAREWIEKAARELVDALGGNQQSAISRHYIDRNRAGWAADAGWKDCDTRLPTAVDADSNGDVLWLRSGAECLGRVARGKPIDATHWKRTGRNCPDCGGSGDSHRYSADIECPACSGSGKVIIEKQ